VSSAAQSRFAAEFAVFVASVAALALVTLRAEVVGRRAWARALLTLGFSTLTVAAFVQGSLVVRDRAGPVAWVQGGAVALLVFGMLGWSGGGRRARLLHFLGLLSVGGSTGLAVASYGVPADALLGAGALLVGAALLSASRQAVAARVAASAAGTLLAVVLVLSVALSAVLASTVSNDAGRRLDARAATETSLLDDTLSTQALLQARVTAITLIVAAADEVARVSDLASSPPSPLLSRLLTLSAAKVGRNVSFVYLSRHALVLGAGGTSPAAGGAASGPPDQATITQVIGTAAVGDVLRTPEKNDERATVESVGHQAVAVGVVAVGIQQADTFRYVGALVAIDPINLDYLASRTASDRSVGLALVNKLGVVVADPPLRDIAELRRLGDQTIDSGAALGFRTSGGRLYSSRPVLASDNQPVMALIASTPSTVVTTVRDELFRTLFIIALGGTLLALLLAALVGDRVGAGLRTLTSSARRIQRGDYSARASVTSDDEVGVLGSAFDSMASSIAAQTEALQRAAEEETALRGQLEAVVAGMGEALIATDATGHITLVNRAAEELLGISASAVLRRPIRRVLAAEAQDGADLASRLDRPGSRRWGALATVRTVGGRGGRGGAGAGGPGAGGPGAGGPGVRDGIPAAISAGPLWAPNGTVVGAVLVVRDLRPERAVERMKNEFLSRVGHELRTPLTGILGYADILSRRSVSPEQARHFYAEIAESGRRLQRIVEMLEFSATAAANRTLIRTEPLNVRAMVAAIVDQWIPRMDDSHSIARRVGRGVAPVMGDRRWLSMAVDELIDNAVKFSPQGGRVVVSADSVEVNGRASVEIAVSDQGVGMTAEEQAVAFEEFAQADSSDTRRFGGLGLGLSLVRGVAQAHGGTVSCQTAPGKGAKFSIVVPALPKKKER